MKTKYEIGDDAWIYVGNHNGEKTKSKVVHTFQLYCGQTYYVCEIPTPIDPLLEVRCAMSMAAESTEGIGLHELVKSGLHRSRGEDE